MIAITERAKTNGAKNSEASGNMGNENRKNPYPPIFNKIAARITEPAVGASTCASGNHVWTGHIGILTAKLAKKASQSQVCISLGNPWVSNCRMSVVPAFQYMAIMASSIRTEPSNVYKKNL